MTTTLSIVDLSARSTASEAVPVGLVSNDPVDVEIVPVEAEFLSCVEHGGGVSALDILRSADGFEVGGVAAGSAGTASRSDVVDGEPLGDLSDPFFVGGTVGSVLDSPDIEYAVSCVVEGSFPKPALPLLPGGKVVQESLLRRESSGAVRSVPMHKDSLSQSSPKESEDE